MVSAVMTRVYGRMSPTFFGLSRKTVYARTPSVAMSTSIMRDGECPTCVLLACSLAGGALCSSSEIPRASCSRC